MNSWRNVEQGGEAERCIFAALTSPEFAAGQGSPVRERERDFTAVLRECALNNDFVFTGRGMSWC